MPDRSSRQNIATRGKLFRQHFGRFFLHTLAAVTLREYSVDHRNPLDAHVRICDGCVILTRPVIDLCLCVRTIKRIKLGASLLIRDSFLGAADEAEIERAHVIGQCELRIELNGAGNLIKSACPIPAIQDESASEHEMGLRQLTVQFHSLLCVSFRLLRRRCRHRATKRASSVIFGKTDPAGSVVRLQLGGLPEIFAGLLILALHPVILAPQVSVVGLSAYETCDRWRLNGTMKLLRNLSCRFGG